MSDEGTRRGEDDQAAERDAAEGPVDRFGLVGTQLDGAHPVERLVAEGGFGVVYQGVQHIVNRPVAIKVLKTPAEYNDRARTAFIEKFVLEAQTVARISHPNIVQVLASGVSKMPSGEVAPWMMLEWLTGHTLESELEARRGRGGRSPAEALALLRPVLEALAYAHDAGIAHRDIKPANIMVVPGRRGGATLKLMDFGIAKLMDEGEAAGSGATRTRTALNAFSPRYAAPEQIAGTRTGPWTDVHALALIACEVLTDAPAYRAEDLASLFGEVLALPRPTPAERGAPGSPWEPVLARALALKPDERYPDAGALLAALEAATPRELAPGASTGASASAAVVAATGPIATAPTALAPAPAATPPTRAPAVPATTTARASAVSLPIAPSLAPVRRTPWLLGALGTLVVLLGVGAFTVGRRRVADPATPESAAARNVATPTSTGVAPPAVPEPTGAPLAAPGAPPGTASPPPGTASAIADSTSAPRSDPDAGAPHTATNAAGTPRGTHARPTPSPTRHRDAGAPAPVRPSSADLIE